MPEHDPKRRVRFVDSLRGVAVLLMVVAHGTRQLPTERSHFYPLMLWLRLIAEMAPAVFFFVVGVSHVLSLRRLENRPPLERLGHRLWAIACLIPTAMMYNAQVLTTAMVIWHQAQVARPPLSRFLHMDIFQLIIASLVALSFLALTRRSWPSLAAAAAVAILYLTVKAPHQGIPLTFPAAIVWGGVFPIVPWLVYPLLGASFGYLVVRRNATTIRWHMLWLCGGLLLSAGLLVANSFSRQAFQKWAPGPNVPYLLLTGGVLMVLVAISPALDRLPGAALLRWLGEGALLVVPLNWALLVTIPVTRGWNGRLGGVALTLMLAAFLAALALVCRFSLRVARWLGQRLPWAPWAALALACAACVCLLIGWERFPFDTRSMTIPLIGQGAVFLAYYGRTRRRAPLEATSEVRGVPS